MRLKKTITNISPAKLLKGKKHTRMIRDKKATISETCDNQYLLHKAGKMYEVEKALTSNPMDITIPAC